MNNVHIMIANILNKLLIMYALFVIVTNLLKCLHKNVLVFALIVLFLIFIILIVLLKISTNIKFCYS